MRDGTSGRGGNITIRAGRSDEGTGGRAYFNAAGGKPSSSGSVRVYTPNAARVAQVGVSGLVPARHPVATQASSSSVRARRLAAVAVLFLLALSRKAQVHRWRGLHRGGAHLEWNRRLPASATGEGAATTSGFVRVTGCKCRDERFIGRT